MTQTDGQCSGPVDGVHARKSLPTGLCNQAHETTCSSLSTLLWHEVKRERHPDYPQEEGNTDT